MNWNIYAETEAFSEKVEPALYENEDIYSLFLGVLNQIKQGKYEDYFLAIAEDEEVVLAACLMTPPHPLQLITFVDTPEVESELSKLLIESGVELNGVIGDRETANRFVLAWTAETGQKAHLLMDQGLYRADAVANGLEKSPGTWRVANKKDAPLLEEWCLLFEVETGIKVSSAAEAARQINQFIENKEVYVWEVDGEVVSCMKKTRPSKRGITVSFVFTPRKHRRKGYARSLVAEVTEELLFEYDFAMLYTDLKNPTSNKIYREIGFEQVANPVHVSFE
ncbi:GNAT family N-acetyltransferase [Planomicrobium sp. CPCC 101110]|uniref:GNAT family N-acetyltransferase n=1 Tax=Planomicrobium sp. CPCC 101110 TaxID=2599619 RepID=UPI0011B5D7BF|nr:GNAT family N-acetyltransferase [Planomicrobium sp. CPCC 101110]TWT24676.1 GNAT family N-acetyltransferase [Planomicrobium sp. CPCC 101110]